MARKPSVYVDSNEIAHGQNWAFCEFGRTSIQKALGLGDYTLKSHFGRFVVERKTLGDAAVSFTTNHDDLRWKMERMSALELGGMVVVEASLHDVAYYGNSAHPNAVFGTVTSWAVKFPKVPIIFAGSRIAAMNVVEVKFRQLEASKSKRPRKDVANA